MNDQVQQEIVNCVNTLRKGGFIIFPDETGWSIGCDVFNSENLEAVRSENSSNFQAVLLDDVSRFYKYSNEFPEVMTELINFSLKPVTLLVENTKNIPAVLTDDENCVAFRIAKDEFVVTLLSRIQGAMGKPLFSMLLSDQSQPKQQKEYMGKPLYVVNLRISSTANTEKLVIIRISAGGKIKFIKK